MGLFKGTKKYRLTNNELVLLKSLASSSVYIPPVTASNVVDTVETELNNIVERVTNISESFVEYETDDNFPNVPVKDALYYVLQDKSENNDLYTPGNELFITSNNKEYSGTWHTKNVNGTIKAFVGANPLIPNSVDDSNQVELKLRTLPEDIQNYYKLATNVFELNTEHDIKMLSAYNSKDASITVSVDTNNSIPPYTVRWTLIDENNNTTPLSEFDDLLTANNLSYGVYKIDIEDSNTYLTTNSSGSGASSVTGSLQPIGGEINSVVNLPYTTTLIIPIYQPQPDIDTLTEQTISDSLFNTLQQNYVSTNEDLQVINQRLTFENNKVNEELIIKRILDNTTLDEQLAAAVIDINNQRNGVIVQSPDTRDKLRVSKIDDDFNYDDLNDRILNRLLTNLPTFESLMNEADAQQRKSQTEETPLNVVYTRNSRGFITSNEDIEEGLISVELIDSVVRKETFSNIVDTEFDQLKSDIQIENEIESLETKIRTLEQELVDLETSAESLINDRVTQEQDITSKQQTIITLESQLDELRNRFAVTPPEGTFFRIPIETPVPNEKIDFWVIENGKRRRIYNYTMLQALLSTVNKTINDVQILQPSQIVQIEKGKDVSLTEFKNPDTRGGIDNSLYIPGEYLRNGKVVTDLYDAFDPINPEVTYEEIIAAAYDIAVKRPQNGDKVWVLPDISIDDLWCTPDLQVRFAVIEHAIYNVQNKKYLILKAKENLKDAIAKAKAEKFARDNKNEFISLVQFTALKWLAYRTLFEQNNAPAREATINAINIQLVQLANTLNKVANIDPPETIKGTLINEFNLNAHRSLVDYIIPLTPSIVANNLANAGSFQIAFQGLANMFEDSKY